MRRFAKLVRLSTRVVSTKAGHKVNGSYILKPFYFDSILTLDCPKLHSINRAFPEGMKRWLQQRLWSATGQAALLVQNHSVSWFQGWSQTAFAGVAPATSQKQTSNQQDKMKTILHFSCIRQCWGFVMRVFGQLRVFESFWVWACLILYAKERWWSSAINQVGARKSIRVNQAAYRFCVSWLTYVTIYYKSNLFELRCGCVWVLRLTVPARWSTWNGFELSLRMKFTCRQWNRKGKHGSNNMTWAYMGQRILSISWHKFLKDWNHLTIR